MPPTPRSRVCRVEDHDDALRLWRAAGPAPGPLVHIDAHPDFEWVDPDGFINIANFLCAAWHEGLIRDVYWIVPDASWTASARRRALIDYTSDILSRYPGRRRSPRITPHEAAWRLPGGRVSIRPLSRLPVLRRPVRLSVDTDFLLIDRVPDVFEEPRCTLPWCVPAQLAARLAGRGWQVESAVIASSVRGGYTPLRWKYLGDELAERLSGALKAERESWWARHYEARVALVERRLDDAAQAYEDMLARHPDHAPSLFGLGEVLAAQGRGPAARAAYAHACALDGAYRLSQDSTALAYFRSGDLALTEQECAWRLAREPDDPLAWYVRGAVAAKERRWADAVAWLQRAVERDGTLLDGYAELGRALEALGRIEEAITAYEQTLRLGLQPAATYDDRFIATNACLPHRVGPDHFQIHRRLAVLYAQAHRPGDAAMSERFWHAAAQLAGAAR